MQKSNSAFYSRSPEGLINIIRKQLQKKAKNSYLIKQRSNSDTLKDFEKELLENEIIYPKKIVNLTSNKTQGEVESTRPLSGSHNNPLISSSINPSDHLNSDMNLINMPIQSNSKNERILLQENNNIKKFNEEKRQGYIKEIVDKIKREQNKIFISHKLKIIFEIIYIITSALLSFVSVIVYAIEFHNKQNNDFEMNLFFINFALAHVFFIEFLVKLILAKDITNYFLAFQPWVDIITFAVPYISLFYLDRDFSLAFLRILRIMSIFKLFNLFKQVQAINKDTFFREENLTYRSTLSKIQKQILEFVIYTISMIFILAGVIQQISLFRPDSFSREYINFIDSLYFMLVTTATIGYGDIYPKIIETRFLIIFIISLFVYLISEQISKITNLYKESRNLQISYNFENHIIFFGEITNDNINQIHFLNFFEELYSYEYVPKKSYERKSDDFLEEAPFCIIMIKKSNLLQGRSWPKLEKFPLFGVKIFILPVNRFDAEAFNLANFQKSIAIFCVNNNVSSNYTISDKIVSFYVRNLGNIVDSYQTQKSFNGGLTKTETLSSCKKLYVQFLYRDDHFSDLVSKGLFFQVSLPRIKMKYAIIAKNLYTRGWSTLITNLFHKHKTYFDLPVLGSSIKNFEDQKEGNLLCENYYLSHYLSCMNQRLTTFKFPDFLHGKLFNDCAKIIYASSVDYINNIRNKDITYEFRYKSSQKMGLSEVLLIGVLEVVKSISDNIKEQNSKKHYNENYNHKGSKKRPLNFKNIPSKIEKNENYDNLNNSNNTYSLINNKLDSNEEILDNLDREEFIYSEELLVLTKKINYNPKEYIVNKEDVGIFIASDFINLEDLFAFMKQQLDYCHDLKNNFFNETENDIIVQNINDSFNNHVLECHSNEIMFFKNDSLNQSQGSELRPNKFITGNQINHKRSSELENKILEYFFEESYKQNKVIVDRNNPYTFHNDMRENFIPIESFKSRYFPYALLDFDENLENHILILGWNIYMEHLLTKIRMESLIHPIVILADDVPHDHVLLSKFKSLYLVKGNFLDLKVLNNLKTQNAHYVIIITSKSDVNPNREDTNSVLVARMIEQNFNVPYIIEIREDSNADLLGSVPVINESDYKEKNLFRVEYIYPNFIQGKILYNCIFDKMNARALTHNFEVACLKSLIGLDYDDNMRLFNFKVGEEYDPSKEIENKFVFKSQGKKDTDFAFESRLEFIKTDYESKIYTDTKIKIFSFPLHLWINRINPENLLINENEAYNNADNDYYYERNDFSNKIFPTYKDLLVELIKINIIPLGIYVKDPQSSYNQINPYKKDFCVEVTYLDKDLKKMSEFSKSNLKNFSRSKMAFNLNRKFHISHNKLKYYSNILRDDLGQRVHDYIQLEEVSTPITITNPHHDMLLTPDMEVIVIGDYQKLNTAVPLSTKVNAPKYKKSARLNRRINKLNSLRNKISGIRRILKVLDKKLKKIKIENLENSDDAEASD
jgi:hypothetical protein